MGTLSLSTVNSTVGNKTIAASGSYTATGALKTDNYTAQEIADITKFSDFIGAGNGTLTVEAPDLTTTYSGYGGLTHPTTLNLYGSVTLYYYSEANPPSGTPEPGTWALIGAGACTSLAAIRRRRRTR
jgi:PEP-CTERM motif